jgi:hypothetical protein
VLLWCSSVVLRRVRLQVASGLATGVIDLAVLLDGVPLCQRLLALIDSAWLHALSGTASVGLERCRGCELPESTHRLPLFMTVSAALRISTPVAFLITLRSCAGGFRRPGRSVRVPVDGGREEQVWEQGGAVVLGRRQGRALLPRQGIGSTVHRAPGSRHRRESASGVARTDSPRGRWLLDSPRFAILWLLGFPR